MMSSSTRPVTQGSFGIGGTLLYNKCIMRASDCNRGNEKQYRELEKFKAMVEASPVQNCILRLLYYGSATTDSACLHTACRAEHYYCIR